MRRNGIERGAQLVGENADHVILCFCGESRAPRRGLGRRLNFRALADVADVALDNFIRADEVNIAHELDLRFRAGLCAERKILVANVFLRLELRRRRDSQRCL